MATIIFFVLVILSSFYKGCHSRECTCRATTQSECESAGRLQYDEDGNTITQCTWQTEHGLCRNTDWLQCKQDRNCLWIKKTTDYVPVSAPGSKHDTDPCDVEEVEEPITYQSSSDGLHENQMISPSIQAQSQSIRVFALCMVLLFITGTGVYHLFENNKKKKTVSNDFHTEQYTYSTF